MRQFAWLGVVLGIALMCAGFGDRSMGRGFGRMGAISLAKKAGPPPVGCAANGLDFTDGCGTTQLMVMLR